MKEYWKVFTDRDTGAEYAAYTLDGETSGEEQATRELIAAGKGIDPARIVTNIESREGQ